MTNRDDSQAKPFDLGLDDLPAPASVFDHPRDVVEDPDLTINEKRAILAAWASDACAIEAMSALRRLPTGRRPMPIDDIVDALNQLDRRAMDRRCMRLVRRSEMERHRHRSGGGGTLSA